MSFTVPHHVPSFANPSRKVEDHLWLSSSTAARAARDAQSAQSGGLLHGVQGRMGGLFDDATAALPMYKDKPFTYAASRRIRPLWRRKRIVAFIGGVLLLAFMWLNGAFGVEQNGRRTSVWSISGFLSDPYGRPDWEARRQCVVQAFELSWDAYEEYAWGESDPLGIHVVSLWLTRRRP